jgi:hypothetical protein
MGGGEGEKRLETKDDGEWVDFYQQPTINIFLAEVGGGVVGVAVVDEVDFVVGLFDVVDP